MKRRRLALWFVLGLVGLLVFWLLRSRSPIDRAIYEAVVLGMPEVEATRLVPIAPRGRGAGRSRIASTHLLAEAGTAHFKNDDMVVKEAGDGTCWYFEVATGKELVKVRFWDT